MSHASTNKGFKGGGVKAFKVEEVLPSGDKLKVFITSWNMGNAEQQGLEYVFQVPAVAVEAPEPVPVEVPGEVPVSCTSTSTSTSTTIFLRRL
jgi:hypothetical protein